jgi:hypothetical protein
MGEINGKAGDDAAGEDSGGHDHDDQEVCPGCGKVHSGEEMSEEQFISTNVEGLVEALKTLVLESNANPRMALAVAVGTAMQLAVQMRAKDTTQDEALRGLAKDVESMCVRHIEMVEASHELRTAAAEDHQVRRERMEQIERMMERAGPLTELLTRNVQGRA